MEVTVEFYDYFNYLKFKNVFMSYKVKLSSHKKNILKTFKHNYGNKILTNGLSWIVNYDKGI